MKEVRNAVVVLMLGLSFLSTRAQQGWWLGRLQRPDGEEIVFNFEWKTDSGRNVWFIKNAAERMRVDNIQVTGDSVIVQMPFFESQFRLLHRAGKLTGVWINRAARTDQVMSFVAAPGSARFATSSTPPADVQGKWRLTYADGNSAPAVAELSQSGAVVTGTVLSPAGDYRYLEGVVRNDSLLLSSFDGSNSYLFSASLKEDTARGIRYSGLSGTRKWTAVKNASAAISGESVAMRLRPGNDRLHFSFTDMEGKKVSIADARFRNKVVLVQLMGSWCPNCMDETAFLSEYYRNNRQRGVEIVALAYEYSTDRDRSVKSLQKFRQRFGVEYPILITGVTVFDSLRTEKTLPELTPIKVFPSLVLIDKKGRVRKIDTGFNGPATGEHYLRYKEEFERTINGLLNE